MISIDGIKDALASLPLAEIHKARLDLAFDERDQMARENESLKAENAVLKSKLQDLTANYEEQRRRYDQLAKEHEEEVVIHNAVEFRRGKRTRGKWLPFCGLCHSPAVVTNKGNGVNCTDSKCKWNWVFIKFNLQESLASLEGTA